MTLILKLTFILIIASCFISIYFNIQAKDGSLKESANRASIFILIGLFLSSLGLMLTKSLEDQLIFSCFSLSTLGFVLSTLVLFISFIVHRFSINFMAGDRQYKQYFIALSSITISSVLMLFSDNLLIFWFFWSTCNLLLVKLIVHKTKWTEALNSGYLALRTLTPSMVSLLIGFLLICKSYNTFSIHEVITHSPKDTPQLLLALILIMFSALTQSAIWPFHRWLTSSLNSPTPVSALMHAGFINGGGILIVRLSSLYINNEVLMNLIFIFGAISALIGTLWKLIQTDFKRMLACSTMAQMGFMMMQCGLGLFPSAIAHLCLHGSFKAYLFLNSGSVIQESKNRFKPAEASISSLVLSLLGGFIGLTLFIFTSEKPFFSLQASTFLLPFVFLACTQLTISMCSKNITILRVLFSFVFVSIVGMFYGEILHLFEMLIPKFQNQNIIQLNIVHLITIFLFVGFWFVLTFGLLEKIYKTRFWARVYVSLLNASQPNKNTITASRNSYNY